MIRKSSSLALGLWFGISMLATDASAVLITQGYGTGHLYRDCSFRQCTTPNLEFSTSDYRFSQEGVPETAPTQFSVDLGDTPSARGTARTEAIAPTDTSSYPELRAAASATEGSRVSALALGVQRYQNVGATPLLLQLDAGVDGTIEPGAGPWRDADDTTEPTFVASRLALFTNASGAFETDLGTQLEGVPTLDAYQCLLQLTSPLPEVAARSCGDSTLAVFYSELLVATAEGAFDLPYSPIAEPIELSPGQSVFLGVSLTAVGLNGGTADAFSTFSVAFIDPISGETITPAKGLRPVSRVSEPSTLLLGILVVVGAFCVRLTSCSRCSSGVDGSAACT